MPSHPTPGRSLVTRRAIADVVRAATLGSYGVTGFAATPLSRLTGVLRLRPAGLRLDLATGLSVDLHLTVAYGVPVAEVARQVDSAVRYAVRRAIGREVDRLTIHVDGLRYQPGGPPPDDTALQDRPAAGVDALGAEPLEPARTARDRG